MISPDSLIIAIRKAAAEDCEISYTAVNGTDRLHLLTKNPDSVKDKIQKLLFSEGWKCFAKPLSDRATLLCCYCDSREWDTFAVCVEAAGIQKNKRRVSGASIAWIGPDGAGKTTMMERAKRHLIPFFDEVETYHSRLPVLPEIRKPGRYQLIEKNVKEGLIPAKAIPGFRDTPINDIMTSIAGIYYILDCCLSRLLLMKKKKRNHLILFDRYFYDMLFTQSTRHVLFPLRKLILKLVPAPDITVHLYADPNVIYRRKKELTVEEIRAENACAAAITSLVPHGRSVDSTDLSVEDETDTVLSFILESLGSSSPRTSSKKKG